MARSLLHIILISGFAFSAYAKTESRVVCYYESKSHVREGQAKFDIQAIEPALEHCTHLVYGYAAINENTFKLVPINEQFDVIKDNYRRITNLKRNYPRLKVLLSVGGNEDVSGEGQEKNLKYREVLESAAHRLTFVNSAHTLVKAFGFDGIDLAWEFPENKPKKIRGAIRGFFHKIKEKVVGDSVMDDKAEQHREQFTTFVKEVKSVFKPDNFLVSVSVLPNVNSTVYFDARQIATSADFINLMAFDFYTPERNPKEADYPAPLYEVIDRKTDENVDFQVRYWLSNGAPAHKINLGIPTYGRAWKMTTDSNIDAIPPVAIDGAGDPGPYTKDAGLLSYSEICEKVNNPSNVRAPPALQYKKVPDPSKRKGSYFYRLPDENDKGGLWVGYDDLETVSQKASYARAKGLGGIAVVDITLDDFRGTCSVERYPILRAIKAQL